MIQKIRAHERYLETRKRSVSRWQVPTEVRKDMLRFVAESEVGQVNRGRRPRVEVEVRTRAALVTLNCCRPSEKVSLAGVLTGGGFEHILITVVGTKTH
jgi:hypothetical protein